MDNKELNELSQKYLNGTATLEEKKKLDAWYDLSLGSEPELITVASDEPEQAVSDRMLQNLQHDLFQRRDNTRFRRLAVWLGSAAAVFILSFFAWQYTANNNPAPVQPYVSVHQLSPKNRVHLTMPDGSKVVLNAGAIFRYPKHFTGTLREVELVKGQAFFDVIHKAGHSFIVKTKTLKVTVLGTSFDVCSNVEDGTTRVSVHTGKVGVTRQINSGHETIMLLPSQQVTVTGEAKLMKKEPAPIQPVKVWYKEDYVYQQESLGNVFKMLEKEYNTKIQVSDKKLLEEGVTVRINNLQPLDTILQILSYTKRFNYQIANDSTVIIK